MQGPVKQLVPVIDSLDYGSPFGRDFTEAALYLAEQSRRVRLLHRPVRIPALVIQVDSPGSIANAREPSSISSTERAFSLSLR